MITAMLPWNTIRRIMIPQPYCSITLLMNKYKNKYRNNNVGHGFMMGNDIFWRCRRRAGRTRRDRRFVCVTVVR